MCPFRQGWCTLAPPCWGRWGNKTGYNKRVELMTETLTSCNESQPSSLMQPQRAFLQARLFLLIKVRLYVFKLQVMCSKVNKIRMNNKKENIQSTTTCLFYQSNRLNHIESATRRTIKPANKSWFDLVSLDYSSFGCRSVWITW